MAANRARLENLEVLRVVLGNDIAAQEAERLGLASGADKGFC